MRLSVPTNWEIELLEALKDYPVNDIYGAVEGNVIGGGRPAWSLPAVTKKQVGKYIEKTHSLGIKFTYLLNAPCLSNIEYNRDSHQRIIKYLKWVNDIGVDYVTVTIPYLMEIIKNQFPKLKIMVSTIAQINSVQAVKFFEALGIDEINVDSMINRDFPLLKKIKEATKCNIQLVLNEICLYKCPFRQYHFNLSAHASQTLHPLKGFYLDYCLIKCALLRFSDFQEILKSRWIRPEDLKEYEEIGVDSFKISGRDHSTKWILNVVKAYANRKYNGNLIDLLGCIETSSLKSKSLLSIKNYKNIFSYILKLPLKLYKDFYDWKLISKEIQSYIYIDNNKLNGFIDFFKNNNCVLSCGECNYCEKWAKVAINAGQVQIDKYINVLSKLLNKFTFSKCF